MSAHSVDASHVYRRFCRAAALAFALVALYTLVVKAPSGGIERDWMHSVLHVLTGALAAYAGWVSADARAARLVAVAILVAYGALGIAGWFIDGLFLGSAWRIPLAVADNVFHLLLTAAAAVVILRTRASPATP